jgi:hypothetical protein
VTAVRLAILVCIIIGAGCSRPKPPTITPEKVVVTSIGPAGIDVLVNLGVENSNSSDLAGRSVTAKVVLDGKHDLGTVSVPREFHLPAGKRTELAVPMSVAWKEFSALLSLAGAPRNIPFDVDGSVSIGGDLLHVDVPFHISGVLTHEQLVQATMNSLPRLLP